MPYVGFFFAVEDVFVLAPVVYFAGGVFAPAAGFAAGVFAPALDFAAGVFAPAAGFAAGVFALATVLVEFLLVVPIAELVVFFLFTLLEI